MSETFDPDFDPIGDSPKKPKVRPSLLMTISAVSMGVVGAHAGILLCAQALNAQVAAMRAADPDKFVCGNPGLVCIWGAVPGYFAGYWITRALGWRLRRLIPFTPPAPGTPAPRSGAG